MWASYDEEADAIYITLVEVEPGGVDHTVPGSTTETETINLDFDSGGKLVGIEIWAASTVLREETLTSVKSS